jgi:hypothetical protein
VCLHDIFDNMTVCVYFFYLIDDKTNNFM